jgi:hypothetical protein
MAIEEDFSIEVRPPSSYPSTLIILVESIGSSRARYARARRRFRMPRLTRSGPFDKVRFGVPSFALCLSSPSEASLVSRDTQLTYQPQSLLFGPPSTAVDYIIRVGLSPCFTLASLASFPFQSLTDLLWASSHLPLHSDPRRYIFSSSFIPYTFRIAAYTSLSLVSPAAAE